MKAIIQNEEGGRLSVTKIPVPKPGKGEVLVKMIASPINPSDLAFLRGGYGPEKKFPVVPGFEGSGIVVASGGGILPKLRMGKTVACASTPKKHGCWAEYMVTQAASCVPLPKEVSPEQGSMMFVNPMTALAFFDIHKRFSKEKGKKVGIINTAAASALGQMIIKLANRQNIPLISIVRKNEQIEMLEKTGAKYVLNSEAPDFDETLKMLAAKLDAMLVFDAVGGNLSGRLLNTVPSVSRMYIYGRLSPEECSFEPSGFISQEKQVKGFLLNHWLKNAGLIKKLKTINTVKRLLTNDLSSPIHRQFPPEEIPEAIDYYKNNMSKGKVIIRF
jgi:NADPH:quinone reductase-like Zn-dependent oxidoreductase